MKRAMHGQRVIDRVKALWPYLILVAVAALILGWYVVGILAEGFDPRLGVTLDDGWIHLSISRNVARHGSWGFNPGERSGGSTSLLWPLLLAGGFTLSDAGAWIALFYNAVLLVLVAAAVLRILQLMGQFSIGWCLLIAALGAFAGNVVWYAFSGMETLLLLACGLWTGLFVVSRRWSGAFVAAMCASLTRPEGFLAALSVVVVVFLTWPRRGGRDVLFDRRCVWAAFLGALTGLAMLFVFNYVTVGQLMPSTLLGRRWIEGLSAGISIEEVVRAAPVLAAKWVYRLGQFSFGQWLLSQLGLPVWFAWSVAGACMTLAALGVWMIWKRGAAAGRWLLIWVLVHNLAYVLVLPSRGHGGRYQPMNVVLAAVGFGVGLWWIFSVSSRWRVLGRFVVRTACVCVLLVVFGSVWVWREVAVGCMEHFDRVHIRCARQLAVRLGPDRVSRIAALDIGALRYFGGHYVIDLGGLVRPEAAWAMYAGSLGQYVERSGADYLVMVEEYRDPLYWYKKLGLLEFLGRSDVKMLSRFERREQRLGVYHQATHCAGPILTVYKITGGYN